MNIVKMTIRIAIIVLGSFLVEGGYNLTYASAPCTTYPPSPDYECVGYHKISRNNAQEFRWYEHNRDVAKFKWTIFDGNTKVCWKDWHDPVNGYGEITCDLSSVAIGTVLKAFLEYQLTNGIGNSSDCYFEIVE